MYAIRPPPYISIHALCEEGDVLSCVSTCTSGDFYPRPLRGGRPSAAMLVAASSKISIHALCEEGDRDHWPLR